MRHQQKISLQCERSITDRHFDDWLIRMLSNLKIEIDALEDSRLGYYSWEKLFEHV